MRIDSHQHYWDLKKFAYPWMGKEKPLYQNLLPADLEPILQVNRFDGSVVVQATTDPQEVWWLLELAKENGSIKGVVGWVDLTSPDLGATLDKLQKEARFKGVRHPTHDEADTKWLLRPQVIAGLKELERRKIPFDLLLRPVHLPFVPELAEKVPDLSMILDHIGKPDIAKKQWSGWAEQMEKLVKIPHLTVKVSGMITEADHSRWTASDLRPYVQHVWSLFGPDRLLFGSDWPVCLLAGQWKQVLAGFTQALGAQPVELREKILGGTAARVYGLTA